MSTVFYQIHISLFRLKPSMSLHITTDLKVRATETISQMAANFYFLFIKTKPLLLPVTASCGMAAYFALSCILQIK